MDKRLTSPVEAADVTEEMIKAATDILTGWYADGKACWEEVWDRMDGMELKDGSILDLGNELLTPALAKIEREARKRC